jgi:hypothetical protein
MFIKEATLLNLSAKTSTTFIQALAVSGGEILTTYAETNGFANKPSRWLMTFRISFGSAFRMSKFINMCEDIIEIENIESAGGD